MTVGALTPDEVFTPRSAVVNDRMYISRDKHERALERALTGNKNIVIYGASGCGKSWLWKSFLGQREHPYMIANMAQASNLGGVGNVFENCFNRVERRAKTGSSFRAGGSLNLGPLKLSAQLIDTVKELEVEPFERCLALMSSLGKSRKSVIVIENFESIIEDERHINDLAGLITLVDDDDYASYGVKLLLVGVPDDIQRYFSKTKFAQTISNRLEEIPEVQRLSKNEAELLLRQGLIGLLNLKIDPDVSLERVAFITDYIPQHLHEIGLKIAFNAIESGSITHEDFMQAAIEWIKSSHSSDWAAISKRLDSITTKIGRRNQTLWAIGNIMKTDFTSGDVKSLIRQGFPASTSEIALNVSDVLKELASGDNPIIRIAPNGAAYRFVSPKYCIAIRTMITKDEEMIAIQEYDYLDD